MQKLTEAEVAALPVDGRDRIVFDTMLSGFAVRVTPAGRKIFLVQASGGGRSRKVSIGQHPDMTVADARREARSALDAIRAGKDPAGERTARLAAHAAGAVTVSELADRWLAEYVRPKLKPRTIADYVKLIDQKIKPRLGHMPVSKVAKSDVVSWHVDMQATPRRANYTVATFRALMTFAEDCGLRPVHSNPARKIKMFRESARERFLSETEIGKAADAIDQAERAGKIGPHAAAGLRLALFSGARSGEITAAQWKHVNFGRRIIRLPDSKTNTPRTVHLSDAAVEVLKTLPRVAARGPLRRAGDRAHR